MFCKRLSAILFCLFFYALHALADDDTAASRRRYPATPAEPVYPESMATRTIPVIHIHTENRDSIIDKVRKIKATLYVESPEGQTGDGIAGRDNPVELTIKGRGNATWMLPKKSYKLTFNRKTELLGLPAHRHFALIAWNYGSGNIEWITSICGMEMARMLGMPWAPSIRPVELILNDNYEGMYFLTESVCIDPGRLDIFEQIGGNEDAEDIPYGWLVELDNYVEENQIVIPEKDNVKLRITHHSPKILSDVQRQWLTDEFTAINEAVYSEGAVDWRQYLDIESLVQYFIIREVMFDTDGFNGSMYMYKGKEEEAKWHFGPIWDIGLNVTAKTDYTVNLRPPYAAAHWELELMRYDSFQQEFLRQWNAFYPAEFNRLEAMAHEVARYCSAADAANAARWPEMSYAASADEKADLFFSRIASYARWLDEHKYFPTVDLQASVRAADSAEKEPGGLYDLQGRRVELPAPAGIYLTRGRKVLMR